MLLCYLFLDIVDEEFMLEETSILVGLKSKYSSMLVRLKAAKEVLKFNKKTMSYYNHIDRINKDELLLNDERIGFISNSVTSSDSNKVVYYFSTSKTKLNLAVKSYLNNGVLRVYQINSKKDNNKGGGYDNNSTLLLESGVYHNKDSFITINIIKDLIDSNNQNNNNNDPKSKEQYNTIIIELLSNNNSTSFNANIFLFKLLLTHPNSFSLLNPGNDTKIKIAPMDNYLAYLPIQKEYEKLFFQIKENNYSSSQSSESSANHLEMHCSNIKVYLKYLVIDKDNNNDNLYNADSSNDLFNKEFIIPTENNSDYFVEGNSITHVVSFILVKIMIINITSLLAIIYFSRILFYQESQKI